MAEPEIAPEQKIILRNGIIESTDFVIDVPYARGKDQQDFDAGVGQWRDLTRRPDGLDCEGLVVGAYKRVGLKIPEGAQNQFNFTIAVTPDKVRIGDLAFLAHDGDINKVYHVGIVHDDKFIIEAREYDGKRSWTGKVCLRERIYWEKYAPNFVGYRAHPKLV